MGEQAASAKGNQAFELLHRCENRYTRAYERAERTQMSFRKLRHEHGPATDHCGTRRVKGWQ